MGFRKLKTLKITASVYANVVTLLSMIINNPKEASYRN